MENAMSKKFSLLVFIGRFRPFHLGHKHVIDTALANADNVLVFVGSANRPCKYKNPWTAQETRRVLDAEYANADAAPIVETLDDHLHDNDFNWLMEVQRKVDFHVRALRHLHGDNAEIKVGLIGHSKDGTSYYLKKFPQWGSIEVPAFTVNGKTLDATKIRAALFDSPCLNWSMNVADISELVPVSTRIFLNSWGTLNQDKILMIRNSIAFARTYRQEHAYVGKKTVDEHGNEIYTGKSYEPSHTTADSILIQSGHVLLGRRKFNPGKGQWALPGGFAGAFEPVRDASLRELSEETQIKLREETLRLAFRFKHVFSDPNRSEDRGRIITHAYLYLLNDRAELAEVEAADDFEEVKWFQLGLLDPSEMYSDHFWIIMKMLAMLPVD
jgi:bifunctional NMN adenylyltransferase/nudix hydrolase